MVSLRKFFAGRRWLVWLWQVIVIGGLAGIVWLESIGCGPFVPLVQAGIPDLGLLLNGIAFAVIGPLLIYRRENNPIGWLTTVIGGFVIVSLFLDFHTECGLKSGRELPGLPLTAWFGVIVSPYYFILQFVILPLIFPTGKFLSNRWRKLTWAGLVLFISSSVIHGLLPGRIEMRAAEAAFPFQNPFGLHLLTSDALLPIVTGLELVLLVFLVLSAIASLGLRWHRARGDEKQQLKWIAYYLITFVLPSMAFGVFQEHIIPGGHDPTWVSILSALSYVGFPVTIGVAILKYRLYDIDLVIRRTITYALLTGLLGFVYFGSIVLFQGLFRGLSGNMNSQIGTVLSTLAIALLFNPSRRRIQRFIDRQFDRRAYDADKVLRRFSMITRDEVAIERQTEALLRVVTVSLKPDKATLWLSSPTEDRR